MTEDWLERILACLEEHGTCMVLGNNVNPMPDLNEAYRAYAESLGKRAGNLTMQEKQQAFLSAVLKHYEDDDA